MLHNKNIYYAKKIRNSYLHLEIDFFLLCVHSKLLHEKKKIESKLCNVFSKLKLIFSKKLSVLTYYIVDKYCLYMDYPCCLMSGAILNLLLHTLVCTYVT